MCTWKFRYGYQRGPARSTHQQPHSVRTNLERPPSVSPPSSWLNPLTSDQFSLWATGDGVYIVTSSMANWLTFLKNVCHLTFYPKSDESVMVITWHFLVNTFFQNITLFLQDFGFDALMLSKCLPSVPHLTAQ
jgi:hypothetical protein